MAKLLYVDSELLNKKIEESGLKIDYLCEVLGLSRQGFLKKRNGITPFRAAEVFALCYLLKIDTVEEKTKIFKPKVEMKVYEETVC